MLTDLRERAGLSSQEAARRIPGAGLQRVWRMETGRVAPQRQLVESLLDLYGASDSEATECLARLEIAQQPPWWNAYADVLTEALIGRLDLESEASLIRIYAPGRWPELLATPDLIRATLAEDHPRDPPRVIERRVELHLRRIEMSLCRKPPVRIWAVIEEAVLHRAVASREVMRAQIRHVQRLIQTRAAAVQILPLTVECGAQLSGALQLVRCDHRLIPDTLVYRTPVGVTVTQKRNEVDLGRLLFENAAVRANRPDAPIPLTQHWFQRAD
jgi:hypothetical protein